MNQAMRDLLDSTLDAWYSYLAAWEAPGETGGSGCELCADSPFSRIDGLGDWPHDIEHALVVGLTSAVRHVRLSLEELDEDDAPELDAHDRLVRGAAFARHAESLVLAGVASRRAAMRDVLEQCIEPSLQAYLSSECERGLLELFAADERDRPVY